MGKQRILKLDELTASKIAAGEVVEKPATVVKELVENAIDAGSTRIQVHIEKGGKKKIMVIDNGSGIEIDDLPLVFERHATSKIRRLEDLYQTASLGFRGEALASICAVSEVELITKTDDRQTGSRVVAKGGKILEISEIGALTGTSITIDNLFFNTPARLKFLKADSTEGKSITELMSHLALSHPEVAFEYTLDGRSIFQTPGNGKLKNAIFEVYGRDMVNQLFEVSHEALGIGLSGFASTFAYTKGNSMMQTVFVNGRFVKSDIIKEAVMLAYKPYLMNNRFPVCVLFLELSPSEIDVNIHPAKTEIKFHQEGDVKQIVYAALRKAFNLQNQIPSVSFTEREVFKPSSSAYQQALSPSQQGKNHINQSGAHEGTTASKSLTEPHEPDRHTTLEAAKENETLTKREPNIKFKPNTALEISSDSEMLTDVYRISESGQIANDDARALPQHQSTSNYVKETVDFSQYDLSALSDFSDEVQSFFRPLETASIYDGLSYVGAFLKTYLIFEKQESMYLVDQHAAHEKMLYEKLMAGFKSGHVTTQMLLVPETINYAAHQEAIAEVVIEALNASGFEASAFGPKTLVLRGIPEFLSLQQARLLTSELIDGEMAALEEHVSEKLMSKACKSAIKAHDNMAPIEVSALLDGLKHLEDPYTCPHGRPIIIEISRGELERKFKRIV